MRILDSANVMSLVRLPLALLVWLEPGNPFFLLTVGAAAAISDALDGWLGRKEHTILEGTKNVGAWLDPLCDKVFIVSVALAVAVTYRPDAAVIALVLLRDIGIAALTLAFRVVAGPRVFHAHDFRATATGKVTTVAQGLTVAAIVVAPDLALPFALCTGLSGTFAILDRVLIALRHRAAMST
jgi:cardiolipin synthase